MKKYASPPRRNDDRIVHYVSITMKISLLGIKFSVKWVKHISSDVGTFGRILECRDRQTRDYVATKVIRNIKVDVLERFVIPNCKRFSR